MNHLLKYGYPQKIVFKLIKNILSIYDGSFLILEYSHHLKHFRINLICEKHGCDSPGHQNTLLFLFMEFLLCLYKRKKKGWFKTMWKVSTVHIIICTFIGSLVTLRNMLFATKR